MMPINVNGTTAPISTAATSHPRPAPISHATTPLSKLSSARGNLHPGRALVAPCQLEGGYAGLEPYARRMLGERDRERRSGKERGAQRGDACKRVQHRPRLPWG